MATGSTQSSHFGQVRIGAFEEVLSFPGRYLNDHCLIRKSDVWHFFGTVGRVPSDDHHDTASEQPPNEGSFSHTTSPDLHTWQTHPDVMHVACVWPEISNVFAPHVIEHDTTFYMFYCATDDRTTQRICLATSPDLFQWRRYAGNPVIVPSLYWSKWPGFGLDAPDVDGSFGGCRDQHILRLDDGRFVAYWVSRLQEKFGKDRVCVAASVSHDLLHWQEVGPIFSMKTWHQPLTLEVESPCVVGKDGRFWLFFKHGWWTHYVVADSPFDFANAKPARLGYAHAAEVFHWRDQWWITHCKTDPDDFMQSRSDCSRGLFLGRLNWPVDGIPALVGP
ncbi:MAG: hypothetical protein QF785_00325 [Phycisphaeraceae bacterium]|jgi:hypothetical protein|nr:hypothetical protein [Phycisphaeraceae bacterium]